MLKKIIPVIITVIFAALVSCSNSQDDSFGYTSPPPTQQDMYSNEAGDLQQAGGVAAGIESEEGNSDDSSELTIKV